MSRSAVIAVLVSLCGCFDSRADVCADGTICRPDDVCAPSDIGGCMAPDLCKTATDGTACGASGACQASECVLAACGNGRMERYETCDDGNLRSHDGCSSTCIAESADWTQSASAQPSATPTTFVFDRMRGQSLLVTDQVAATVVNALWEWDGEAWTKLTPAAMPSPARQGAYMAYDEVSRRVLLVGGEATASSFASDTWSWDGATWTRISTTPATLAFTGVAFDPNLNRLVLFGGLNGPTAVSSSMMSWDGSVWNTVVPATSPSKRFAYAIATDSHSRRVLVFGGDPQDGTGFLDDMWAWNGTTWMKMVTAIKPGARKTRAFAFDAASDLGVMYGGAGAGITLADTWVFSANDWRSVVSAAAPDLQRPAMVYDSLREEFLLVGETTDATPARETWRLRFDYADEPEETCIAGEDGDTDGLKGCADPDCWARCTPFCPPGATNCDPNAPRCGDGACNAMLETQVCPEDCP